MMKNIKVVTGLLVCLVVLFSCSLPDNDSPHSITEPTRSTPTVSLPGKLAEHPIEIRQIDGAGEFFYKQTGEKFIPRGVNYAFVPQGDDYTNLVLRVGTYNPQRTRDDFLKLAALGYNTVRVFLDHCNRGPECIGNTDSSGLNPAYLDNIADMTLAAREAGIVLLFTSNDLPDDGGYAEEANSGSGGNFAGYRNSYYLRPKAISATRRYWQDILTGLNQRNAAYDAILGWQLLNEQWMFRDQPPLSLSSGTVETTTGSFDMSDTSQKEQMVSEGLIYYIAQMKEEILTHDPTALVTMGFFVPELVAPGWYVETASLLAHSDLDFFDFHAYPGDLSFEAHAEAFGMLDYKAKPIILGEYGAFRNIYPQIDSGARALTAWKAESCQFGFDGWLYWAYYPSPASAGDRTWGMTDEDGYLLELFAPTNQPDPCMEMEIPNDNLAHNKPVRASRSLAEEPPEYAVDDNENSQWGAGASPVQWIEVDLQDKYRLTKIQLLVAQWPEGQTTHLVQVRTNKSEGYTQAHEFSGFTREGDWLVYQPNTPLENVGQVRIQTVSSPSWVAWKEIQFFGELMLP